LKLVEGWNQSHLALRRMMERDVGELVPQKRIAKPLDCLPCELFRTIDSTFHRRHDFLEQQSFQPLTSRVVVHRFAHGLESFQSHLAEQGGVSAIEDSHLAEEVGLHVIRATDGRMLGPASGPRMRLQGPKSKRLGHEQ